jgi:uncharacterized protein
MSFRFKCAIALLIVSCGGVAGSVVAGPFEDGLHALDSGNYESAMRLLRPLAAEGDARAQYTIGVMYEEGRGVPREYSEAVGWLLQAADQGNADAQNHLGFLYLYGRGVTKDYVVAYMWFDLAATEGAGHAAFSRDLVAANMTPSQVAEAHKLASERKRNRQ